MYTVIEMTCRAVAITSGLEILVFSVNCYKRAQGRQERGASIRKPVKVLIDDQPFIFTQTEWDASLQGWEAIKMAKWTASFREIPRILQEETQKRIMNSKNLSKIRAARIRKEADGFAEEHGIKNNSS